MYIRPDQGGDRPREQDGRAAGLGLEESAERRLQAPRPRGPSGTGGLIGLGVHPPMVHIDGSIRRGGTLFLRCRKACHPGKGNPKNAIVTFDAASPPATSVRLRCSSRPRTPSSRSPSTAGGRRSPTMLRTRPCRGGSACSEAGRALIRCYTVAPGTDAGWWGPRPGARSDLLDPAREGRWSGRQQDHYLGVDPVSWIPWRWGRSCPRSSPRPRYSATRDMAGGGVPRLAACRRHPPQKPRGPRRHLTDVNEAHRARCPSWVASDTRALVVSTIGQL